MKTLDRFLTPTGAIRAWATVTMLIVGFGLALGLTIGYVQRVDDAAERRNIEREREICGLIVVLDDAYRQIPPATQLGKNIADEIHRYRLRLDC
ncbi:hypothetical protein Drose_04100 [Dactylosporangium roseum]|uniref:Two-component sensor histidine kinase n=1 Tax=Dactylosporangium roseum TaxID=47989 RepID=A0ABY5Z7A5_9ACTN|nr:hypothetical protein [Dactylosporangium roseum]UWZ37471.1 hypothetical protein Drose_04100 [Dactylosporangium roseum]